MNLARILQVIPQPDPVAPPGVADKAGTVMGFIMWGSIVVCTAALLGMGFMVLASDHGHGGGLSPQMKGTFGKVIVAMVTVSSASAIVNFLL